IAEIRLQREQFLAGQTPVISPSFQALLPEPEVVTAIAPPPQIVEIAEVAEVALSKPKAVLAPVEPKITAEPKTSRQNLRIPLERLTRMSNTVSELLINHERLLIYDKQLRQASRSLKQRSQQLVPMREQVESLYDELTFSEAVYSNGSEPETLAPIQNFDALEFDRYSSVHTILQRFQELMVQVQEIQEDVDIVERDLQETLIDVRSSLNSLDTDLTESRLLPFGPLAKSFIQPLEKLSERYKKPTQVVIIGENVLVEVSVLEQLRTPLTHLIRNAFDHGLELPKERRSQGKDTQGTLTLKAETQGNQVLITVADDGRGINLEKIRQKALALGILSEKEAKTNQPDRILDCLFAPGFSTATQVSDLSGRGLGLDIVKHLIESLRGTIKLETEAGKGSRFIIRIP
ncbi:MAG: ATP-binding protein, partial [Microcystaceae cyanobacterium]